MWAWTLPPRLTNRSPWSGERIHASALEVKLLDKCGEYAVSQAPVENKLKIWGGVLVSRLGLVDGS